MVEFNLNSRIENINLIMIHFVGSLAFVLFMLMPKNLSYSNIIFPALVVIFVSSYYILGYELLLYYSGKYIPKIQFFLKNHISLVKKVSAILGMTILFFILIQFVNLVDVLKIYGVAILTYLFSFLKSPKDNSENK